MQKPKYITNKDLLREIHSSKTTFCYFQKPEYANFDVIVTSRDLITPELIDRALTKKCNPKVKAGEVVRTDYTKDDLVIRLMTHEHIPLDPDRKRKARNTDVSYARTNFPPFKHFIIRDDKLIEVGRSHWNGTLEEGGFCLDKGAINSSLAVMFMMLVDRYSRRGNWRGYCYDSSTEMLTQRGWLNHEQLATSDTILSYDCDDGKMKWSPVHSIFKDTYNGEMFHLTVRGMDALVTPGHKFIVKDYGLKRAEYLLETDRVVVMGKKVDGPDVSLYSDEFVELVGWMATEGNFSKHGTYERASIYQNPDRGADRIRRCLKRLGQPFSEFIKKGAPNIRFQLGKKLSVALVEVIKKEGKVISMPFILSLTNEQRILLIDTMVAGDGWLRRSGKSKSYTQKNKEHVDAFRILCTLSGIKTSETLRSSLTPTKAASEIYTIHLQSPRLNVSRVENIDFHGGKRSGSLKGAGKLNHPNEPTVPYNGVVWCPRTDYGTVMCRRNGTIYLGSNTYVDEMRSHALLQLSQVGLQFDESKGDNPFAFFTTTIQNCFTRVLNVERRNQNIRDDILIMSGVTPSYTRQIENEMEYRMGTDASAPPVKRRRGPPPKRKPAVEPVAPV